MNDKERRKITDRANKEWNEGLPLSERIRLSPATWAGIIAELWREREKARAEVERLTKRMNLIAKSIEKDMNTRQRRLSKTEVSDE